ncbi:MAG: methylated-DNA--[protein]-cysteine S-methyltransferase [Chloroflexi bacterium]|nr:methylated-DNA--[protein]-cysteine S-methyltransferase [Chloroflexota bacterium]
MTTSWGFAGVLFGPRGLRAFSYPTSTKEEAEARQRLEWPDAVGVPADPWDVVEQLQQYFAGEPVAFNAPLDLGYASPFMRQVWNLVCQVPYGETRTYSAVARQAGRPRAARAVGLANARNPIPVIIPCHRLLGSDGALRGYGGGLDFKRRLLQMERATAARLLK